MQKKNFFLKKKKMKERKKEKKYNIYIYIHTYIFNSFYMSIIKKVY